MFRYNGVRGFQHMKYDKGSFIVVPNRASVLGVSGMAQALYMWLCYYANQSGDCFPSRQTLSENLHCDEKTVDKYLKELIDFGLVSKVNRFENNKYTSNLYSLPMYSRVGENIPHSGENISLGVGESLRTELNPVLTQSTEQGANALVVVDDSRKIKKDSEYLSVFQLWGKYPLNWMANRTEIAAAKNMLDEHGLPDIERALTFAAKNKDEEMCPQILKPSDLDRKWVNLQAFRDKNGH